MSRAQDGIAVEILKGPAALRDIQPEWDALEARASRRTVFLTHKWLRTAWAEIQSGFPNRLRLLLVRDGGELVMAGAFVLGLFRLTPVIRFLTFGTPQDEDVLYLASERTPLHAEALLRALGELPSAPRQLRAERLREDSPLYAAAERLGLRRRRKHRIGSVYLTLTRYAGYDDYLGQLSAKTRSGLKRRQRDLDALPGYNFRREPPEAVPAVLAWLFDTKRQWAREGGHRAPWLMNRSVDRFMAALLSGEDVPEHWVLTHRDGERIIAAKLCFVAGRTLIFSKIAHDPAYAHHSPGLTLNLLMLREAFAAGLALVEFGQGTVETKKRLSKELGHVVTEKFWLR